MVIYKTMVAVEGDPELQGYVLKMDTIEHDGRFWLVPQWYDYRDDGMAAPVRLIGLHCFEHQDTGPTGEFRFVLTRPISKAVLDGHQLPPPAPQIDIVEAPQLKIRGGHGVN